jgi:hypothetical protein
MAREALGAQDRQMLRDIGLLRPEVRHQRAGGLFTLTEQLQNRNAGGMGQRLTDGGFELLQGRGRRGHARDLPEAGACLSPCWM